MKRFALIVPILLFVGLGVTFAIGLTRDPTRIPSQLIDRPLPEFDLAAIDKYPGGLSTEELKGEVAMINIFGSWCISCRVEHPMLMELAETQDTPIYGVNWRDPPGAGTAWLDRFGNPYDLIGDDAKGRVAIDLGVTGAPETFLIDRQGRVRYKHIGPITPEVWREVLAPLIDELEKS